MGLEEIDEKPVDYKHKTKWYLKPDYWGQSTADRKKSSIDQ
jgi:hypothetical protein